MHHRHIIATEPRALDRSAPLCRLVTWTPAPASGRLVGWATVSFSGGWRVASIPIFRAEGALSAGVPSIPMTGHDGSPLRDADGRRRYTQIITFETAEARTRWSTAVLSALREAGVGGAP